MSMNSGRWTGLSAKAPPPLTLAWGWAGVVPFTLLCWASLQSDPGLSGVAATTLVPYGAIILTFMGGIHWGLAIDRVEHAGKLFNTGILPSLFAVAAIVLPYKIALFVLVLGFIGLLVFDLRLVHLNIAPAWYGRLRQQLTAVVVACLVVAGWFA